MPYRLLYRSDSLLTGTADDVLAQVGALVLDSGMRNAACGLTGALLFTGSVFVQVLEGDAAAIEHTFERICNDLRHRRVTLIEFSRAPARVFGPWSMAGIRGDDQAQAMFPAFGDGAAVGAAAADAAVALMRDRLERSGVMAD